VYNILANLPFKTNHVHYLPSCHSTNEVAKDLLQTNAQEGTVVITDDQFAGKGQEGSIWTSLPGQNLTFSLILRPVFFKPNEQFLITVAVSLGLKDVLEDFIQGEVKIKWPNDIYFNNKKIAGLLIENVLRGNCFDSCVVGIGLNVNQINFPDTVLATSLKLATSKEYNLNELLNSIITSISFFYSKLIEGKGNLLQNAFNSSLLGLAEERKFKAGEAEFFGIIEGTDSYGRLKIRKESKTVVFQHKQVKMLF